MRPMNMKNATSKTQLLLTLVGVVTLLLTPAAFAAAPGISGTGTVGTFNLTAQDAFLNMPDGEAIYSWGYGCATGSAPTFVPAATFAFTPTCNSMQVPGPTLVVTEGVTVTVNLINQLPPAAGNTSILFPGFNVSTSCTAGTPVGQQGLLTCEAAPNTTVTYTFVASAPGTHPYYSGTQGDLQIEMGLYGAVIVLPASPPSNCSNANTKTNLFGKLDYGTANGVPGFPEQDFRLSTAAFDHPKSCYDREYLFQWAEMDSRVHRQAQAQVLARVGCTPGMNGCSLDVQTEPYHPAYFLINGRSMPDLMDPNYATQYPHQPYNGNPHMHPGELTLVRTIGQGRWQHPFHEHANHVRILARDADLVLSPTVETTGFHGLAGTLMFNTDTTPGESFDGIFYYSGRGLNWDAFGHHPAGSNASNSSFTITNLSETGNTVTATVNGDFTPINGTTLTIAGVSTAGYNGSFAVNTSSPGVSTSTFMYTDSSSGLGTLTGASLGTATISSLTQFPITAISATANAAPAVGYTVTATVTGVLPASISNTSVIIAGVTPAGYNGSYTVNVTSTTASASTFTYTALVPVTVPPTVLTSPGTVTAGTSLASANLGATSQNLFPSDPLASLPCIPDQYGYNTTAATGTTALNYYEWCQDHNKPIQVSPFGDVAGGGPATFPDPDVFTNGAWYGGTPYFGPDAVLRSSHPACGTTQNSNCTDLQPSNVQANPPKERGWAFMWHSHNEREITTNNVFPGGMLMMMLVDSREFAIDESQ